LHMEIQSPVLVIHSDADGGVSEGWDTDEAIEVIRKALSQKGAILNLVVESYSLEPSRPTRLGALLSTLIVAEIDLEGRLLGEVPRRATATFDADAGPFVALPIELDRAGI